MRCAFRLFAALILPCVAWNGDPCRAGDPRGVVVEQIRNENPSFLVRASVDHADRVYRGGETMTVSVTSQEAGYLYLFYCDANRQASCLFPNKHQTDNLIPAQRAVQVPAKSSSFRLRVGAPYGEEVLKAVVTKRPLQGLELESLTKGDVTPIDLEKAVRAVQVEYADRPTEWAEHHVKIVTLAPDQERTRECRRVGLFIGISTFATVSDLTICHEDALQMAQVMQRLGQLDEAIILTDQSATLSAVRAAFSRLVELTQAGDEVFIYWSGHGGQCTDDNGDEADGYDEFLVPYDGKTDDLDTIRRTMLMDDTFGRWLQDLDGRKVAVILDACHSGGQAAGAKGLFTGGTAKNAGAFDFFDGEMNRAKDIGQLETVLLCSSQADELSYERNEKDLSVMTYYLIKELKDSSQLTIPDAYQTLHRAVAEYVAAQSNGNGQTPVLYDNTSSPLYLRP